MFDRLVHADWSIRTPRRWAATAQRQDGRWQIENPAVVCSSSSFLDDVFSHGVRQRVMLGFDFPIGLPAAYGIRTGFPSFKDLFPLLGAGPWKQFYEVALRPHEVSLWRPFYPRSSKKGVTRNSLVAGLAVEKFDDLLRVCERRTENRRAACSLFWTLGGNQVGKGAISGWQEIVGPALRRGASLWPFDGALRDLAGTSGVVLAETYPAEAYRLVGAEFLPRESKRRQADRKLKSKAIRDLAAIRGIIFSEDVTTAIVNGFGSSSHGEDQFDAFVGLLQMIEIADGRQPEATEYHPTTAGWEGWILGR